MNNVVWLKRHWLSNYNHLGLIFKFFICFNFRFNSKFILLIRYAYAVSFQIETLFWRTNVKKSLIIKCFSYVMNSTNSWFKSSICLIGFWGNIFLFIAHLVVLLQILKAISISFFASLVIFDLKPTIIKCNETIKRQWTIKTFYIYKSKIIKIGFCNVLPNIAVSVWEHQIKIVQS